MKEHAITVPRTARYFTLGNVTAALQQLWFVLHGYGQLAAYFLKHFEAVADGRRLIVAPEGLSRFYLQGFTERVGASWMTREDRLHEIDDYVNYLDAVYQQIFSQLNSQSIKVTALGFSQGTAAVSRWVSRSNQRIDQLILWGGLLPPDLDLQKNRNVFQNLRLIFVVGKNDEFANPKNLAEQQARLRELAIQHEVITFDGGHEIHPATLKQLALTF